MFSTSMDQDFRDQPSLFDFAARSGEGRAVRDAVYRDKIAPTLGERQQIVYSHIVSAGVHGVTVDELCHKMHVTPNVISGRVTQLADMELVIRTKDRRKTSSGSSAGVIVAAEFYARSQQSS